MVRDATDLVRLVGEHVALRPKGREHVGLCPFHDDKNPSFCVVTHKGNAFYKCHSCGAGGDAFDFVKNYHRMDFAEALRFLADRAGITLRPRRPSNEDGSSDQASTTRTTIRKANAFAATFFQRILNDPASGAAARDVITQRGISDSMVEAFMLGAAPDQWDALHARIRKQSLDPGIFVSAGLLKKRTEGEGFYDAFRNRLIFPICDELGNPIAFGARKIDPEDEPKYLNSAESAIFSKSRTLYGLNLAKREIIAKKCAIVTEGYTDVIACHQAGFTNVVATLGTALTREHAQILSRLCDKIILLFDGDEAGQKAGSRGFEVLASHFGLAAFLHEKVDIQVCVLPDELDPDELLKQPDGADRFNSALDRSRDVLDFVFDRFSAQLRAAGGLSARQKASEGFLTQLAELGFAKVQGLRRSLILNRLAELLGVSPAQVDAAMPKPRNQGPTDQVAPDARANLTGERTSSARRRAEEDLLAILIYQPELHADVIALSDERQGTIAQLIDVSDFEDSVTGAIAAVVFPWLAQSAMFTVQQLLAELNQPEARNLASSLYFAGQQACEGASSPAERLAGAVQALDAHINLERYRYSVDAFHECKDAPEQALVAAQAVIQQRRRQGHVANAIGRGVREIRGEIRGVRS